MNFFKNIGIQNTLLDQFYETIHIQHYGKDLGLQIEDESGKLTLNIAQFKLEERKLIISMNLRIPVHTSIEEIKEKLKNVFEKDPIAIEFLAENPPLYLSKTHPLLLTLSNVFHETTGLDGTPIAIGGATYARAFPNCISFGPNMPGNKDMCHQIDEFISIDNLILSCKIYTNAIYKLATSKENFI